PLHSPAGSEAQAEEDLDLELGPAAGQLLGLDGPVAAGELGGVLVGAPLHRDLRAGEEEVAPEVVAAEASAERRADGAPLPRVEPVELRGAVVGEQQTGVEQQVDVYRLLGEPAEREMDGGARGRGDGGVADPLVVEEGVRGAEEEAGVVGHLAAHGDVERA